MLRSASARSLLLALLAVGCGPASASGPQRGADVDAPGDAAQDGSADAASGGDAADAGDTGDAGGPANCMQRHLREAIALNGQRRPRYSARSAGASEAISDMLIASEQLGLGPAADFDARAVPYQQQGIALLCAEFVPMAGAPPYADSFGFPPQPLAAFQPQDGAALAAAIQAAYDAGGFPAAAGAAAGARAALDGLPSFHCMLRHLLDSVVRIADYAPRHDARAQQLGLPPAGPLSWEVIRLHLGILGLGADLDARAAPLQAADVPILCRDVPPIPP